MLCSKRCQVFVEMYNRIQKKQHHGAKDTMMTTDEKDTHRKKRERTSGSERASFFSNILQEFNTAHLLAKRACARPDFTVCHYPGPCVVKFSSYLRITNRTLSVAAVHSSLSTECRRFCEPRKHDNNGASFCSRLSVDNIDNTH